MTRCVNASLAFDAACRLDLDARITARLGSPRLEAELGPELARRAALRELAVVAAHRLLMRALEETLPIAEQLGVELVLLKHAALVVAGVVREGERDVRDVDVLAPPRQAEPFRQALLAAGYSDTGHGSQPHHLPAVSSPHGEVFEIHTSIPGLSIPPDGPRSAARVAALRGARLLERREIGGHACWVPVRELLCAHALVHGFVQHAARPDDYPMMRMIADLVDLAPWQRGAEGEGLIRELVVPAMTPAEVGAALDLARALARGSIPEPGSAERSLLDHVVAAAFDENYRRSLALLRLDGLTRPAEVMHAVRRALVPARADVESRFGRAASPSRAFVNARLYALTVLQDIAGAASARLRTKARGTR